MDPLSGILRGFNTALTYQNLFNCLLGCFLGTLTGVLHGFGPGAAVGILVGVVGTDPVVSKDRFTFGFDFLMDGVGLRNRTGVS